MKPLAQYLARHAEPEIAIAAHLPAFDHVICVPAAGEPASFLDDLRSPSHDGVLTIVVVNGIEGDDAAARANADTLAALSAGRAPLALETSETMARAPRCFLREAPTCLVIDRASPGRQVPKKQAVGLARKIAADVACALFAQGKLRSRWIHMTDCDVVLPAEYLLAAPGDEAAEHGVLLTYPFRHVPGSRRGDGDAAVDQAHGIYEAFLRYYVLGLRWAGSPYALHTIGSTLAADVNAYAAVRGMPRRDAAEDFYLVNKIAKLGAVITPSCPPLEIVSRRSLRVPFGTGRSTAAIVDAGGREFYDPAVFVALRAWLSALEHYATGVTDTIDPVARALELVEAELRAPLGAALEQLDARRTLERALAAAPRNAEARLRRAHEHFDAFRTRKLIHLLRDAGLGERHWREALDDAPFIEISSAVTSSEDDSLSIAAALATCEAASTPPAQRP